MVLLVGIVMYGPNLVYIHPAKIQESRLTPKNLPQVNPSVHALRGRGYGRVRSVPRFTQKRYYAFKANVASGKRSSVTKRQDMNRWTAFRTRRVKPRLRLFCVPYAGAGARLFRGWDEALPKDMEICPIELPGRGTRLGEPATPDMESLVRPMAESLQTLLDLPYAILGCSMGALVGFELAHALRRLHGREPAALVAVSQNAPSAPLQRRPARLMSDDELGASLRRFGGMSGGALDNPRVMRLFLPVLRADYSVVDTYIYNPERPLQCPIHLFVGAEDPSVSDQGLSGWRQETSASVTVRRFSGSHFFFRDNELRFLVAVSSRLRECI